MRDTDLRDIAAFYETATEIWAAYQQSGPGGLDPAMDASLPALAAKLRVVCEPDEAGMSDFVVAVKTLVDLGHRCCHRPEGLCFISGEAGLIPRRDLHEQYARALNVLAAAIANR